MKRISLYLLVNILIVTSFLFLTKIIGLVFSFNIQPQMPSLILFIISWGISGSFLFLFFSKILVKKIYDLQVVSLNGPHRDLVLTTHRLARRASLTKMPEIAIYQSNELNAFTTGFSKDDSIIAISSELILRLEDHEIEGILAHEISHIANGDMVTMTLLTGITNVFGFYIAGVIGLFFSSLLNKNEDHTTLVQLIEISILVFLAFVFGLLALIVIALFSRHREYRADQNGAEITSKEIMITSLNTLKRFSQVHFQSNIFKLSFKSLNFINGFFLKSAFLTHPSLDSRIAALSNGRFKIYY